MIWGALPRPTWQPLNTRSEISEAVADSWWSMDQWTCSLILSAVCMFHQTTPEGQSTVYGRWSLDYVLWANEHVLRSTVHVRYSIQYDRWSTAQDVQTMNMFHGRNILWIIELAPWITKHVLCYTEDLLWTAHNALWSIAHDLLFKEHSRTTLSVIHNLLSMEQCDHPHA